MCCAGSTSMSPAANAWCSTGAPAPARAPCCARSTGNYLPAGGSIRLRHAGDWLELVGAEPREVLAVRRQTLGYVSQFLRVIPRVATLDVVMEPALARGWSRDSAELRAAQPAGPAEHPGTPLATGAGHLFPAASSNASTLPAASWSSGPILLLDEPTASLDEANRQVVLELIGEAKAAGAALIGIFHDRRRPRGGGQPLPGHEPGAFPSGASPCRLNAFSAMPG
ncbi:phosphonate ABC transporter ATPase [Pseudomonas aeruginosa]|nr:phosphonate ABC transporter ATPase [Pseudomonas aeruginosa]